MERTGSLINLILPSKKGGNPLDGMSAFLILLTYYELLLGHSAVNIF